jgi:regulatory protein YycH of two-component signal transduction system YycFG
MKRFKKIVVALLTVLVVMVAYLAYNGWNSEQKANALETARNASAKQYVQVAEKTSKCREACIYHPEGYSIYWYNEEKDVCYCRHSTFDKWVSVPIE